MIQPVLFIVIPLLLAFISVMIKHQGRILLSLGVIVNVGLLFFMEKGEYILGGHKPPYGIVLTLDQYSFLGLIVLNGLFALLMLIQLEKLEAIASVLLIALGSLNGLLLTGDLFNLFVFLEISSIAAFILVATNKRWKHVFNYIIIATLGSSFYLLGVILLYSQYGTLNMAKMSELMNTTGTPGSYIPVLFIFIGLAVETKLLPFNGWVKGVLGRSDSLVGPMIGSIYAGVMLLVFGRLFTDIFVINETVTLLLSMVAVVTLLAGEFAAFSTTRLREVLLYSSIAQSGLAVVLFLNGYGTAALLVVFANVVSKFILFLLAAHMANNAEGSDDFEVLGGLFKSNPLNGLGFTIATLSLASLPLFFGFFVKINVLYSLFIEKDYVLPAIILGASLIEGAYFIRMLVKLWNPGQEGELSTMEQVTPLNYSIKPIVCYVALTLSLTLVILGISPDLAISKAKEAGSDLLHNRVEHVVQIEGGTK